MLTCSRWLKVTLAFDRLANPTATRPWFFAKMTPTSYRYITKEWAKILDTERETSNSRAMFWKMFTLQLFFFFFFKVVKPFLSLRLVSVTKILVLWSKEILDLVYQMLKFNYANKHIQKHTFIPHISSFTKMFLILLRQTHTYPPLYIVNNYQYLV